MFSEKIPEEEEFSTTCEEEEEIPEEILPESMRSRKTSRLLMRNFSQKRRNWNGLLILCSTEEETDALNIVPRERELRDEEKKLFTYFVKDTGNERAAD